MARGPGGGTSNVRWPGGRGRRQQPGTFDPKTGRVRGPAGPPAPPTPPVNPATGNRTGPQVNPRNPRVSGIPSQRESSPANSRLPRGGGSTRVTGTNVPRPQGVDAGGSGPRTSRYPSAEEQRQRRGNPRSRAGGSPSSGGSSPAAQAVTGAAGGGTTGGTTTGASSTGTSRASIPSGPAAPKAGKAKPKKGTLIYKSERAMDTKKEREAYKGTVAGKDVKRAESFLRSNYAWAKKDGNEGRLRKAATYLAGKGTDTPGGILRGGKIDTVGARAKGKSAKPPAGVSEKEFKREVARYKATHKAARDPEKAKNVEAIVATILRGRQKRKPTPVGGPDAPPNTTAQSPANGTASTTKPNPVDGSKRPSPGGGPDDPRRLQRPAVSRGPVDPNRVRGSVGNLPPSRNPDRPGQPPRPPKKKKRPKAQRSRNGRIIESQ